MGNYFTGLMPSLVSTGGGSVRDDDSNMPVNITPSAPVSTPSPSTPTSTPVHSGNGGRAGQDTSGMEQDAAREAARQAAAAKAYQEEQARRAAILKAKIEAANYYSKYLQDQANAQRNADLQQQASDKQVAEERSQWMNADAINNHDLTKLNYQDPGFAQFDKVEPWELDAYLQQHNLDYTKFDRNNPAAMVNIPKPTAPIKAPAPAPVPVSTPPPVPPVDKGFGNAFGSQATPAEQKQAPAQQAPANTTTPAAQAPAPVAQQSTAPSTSAMNGPQYIQQKVASRSAVAPTTPKAQPETQVKGGVPIPVNTKSGLGF